MRNQKIHSVKLIIGLGLGATLTALLLASIAVRDWSAVIILQFIAAALGFYSFKTLLNDNQVDRARPPRPRRWSYEIFYKDDTVSIVAEVPGPEDNVQVRLEGETLRIMGASGFTRELVVKRVKDLLHYTYVNGVLNVRLLRKN